MLTFSPFNKTFLTIGPLELKYYGLMYAIGAIVVYFLSKKLIKQKKIKISDEELADLLTYGIAGVILGGRLGYVLFYKLSYYLENPLKIFAVWEGGMSFHGGFLGVLIGGYLYCKKNKRNFYELADIGIIPVFIALALGRLGNFINGELVGRLTDLPWGMEFNGYEGSRHPSQLYAMGKNIFIFSLLWNLQRIKKIQPGTIFWSGIMLYGFMRFFVEFARKPDEHIGFIFSFITMGQLLSLPMFVIGLGMVIWLNSKEKGKPKA